MPLIFLAQATSIVNVLQSLPYLYLFFYISMDISITITFIQVKVTVTVMKQLKQLQIKPRKNYKAPTGFKPMTSMILVLCSADWAMKPRWKEVRYEFNLYPLLYMKRMTWCVYDIHLYSLSAVHLYDLYHIHILYNLQNQRFLIWHLQGCYVLGRTQRHSNK